VELYLHSPYAFTECADITLLLHAIYDEAHSSFRKSTFIVDELGRKSNRTTIPKSNFATKKKVLALILGET